MNSWAMTDSAWCMGDGSPDFCADCTWYEDNSGHCVHPAQFKEDIDGTVPDWRERLRPDVQAC